MRDNNKQPPSVAALFMKYSTAKVLTPSTKRFITRTETDNSGKPIHFFSRELNDTDVVMSQIRKYA